MRVSLSSVAPVMLSFVGAGRSTAVVGGLCSCWAVGVICWVLAVVCCSLSALHVVVGWAVVICWVAGFVCGGGCVTWQLSEKSVEPYNDYNVNNDRARLQCIAS